MFGIRNGYLAWFFHFFQLLALDIQLINKISIETKYISTLYRCIYLMIIHQKQPSFMKKKFSHTSFHGYVIQIIGGQIRTNEKL